LGFRSCRFFQCSGAHAEQPHRSLQLDASKPFVLCDADRARESGLLANAALDVAGERFGRLLQCRCVEIGFVDPHILHDRREPPQNVLDQARDAAVLLVIDAQEDAVGAQFVRRCAAALRNARRTCVPHTMPWPRLRAASGRHGRRSRSACPSAPDDAAAPRQQRRRPCRCEECGGAGSCTGLSRSPRSGSKPPQLWYYLAVT